MQPKSVTTAIEINHLTTILGGVTIHKGLHLKVNKGEILGVVGGSGCGKTTLLRAILMLIPVTGEIKVFGKDILSCSLKEKSFVRSNWGVMFQHGALFSSLNVLENVSFPLFEYTTLDKKTITQIAKLKLGMVGFPLEAACKYPSELSGGMNKRASLARAIALDPKLLFLDEPTAGLDPSGASALDELIISLRENLGLTIIMVTHDLDTLWRTTDRVAFLGEGKVLAVDTMKALQCSKIPMIKKYFSDERSKVARVAAEKIREK